MASLRCPRCSGTVEVAGEGRPHCPTCNFPWRDSRPAREIGTPGTAAAARETPAPRRSWPVGIFVVAGLDVLFGGAVLVYGFVLATALQPSLWFAPYGLRLLGVASGWAGVVLGVAAILLGVGLVRGMEWAWTAQVTFAAWSVLSDGRDVLAGSTRPFAAVVLSCLVAAYFITPAARTYCGKLAFALPAFLRLRGTPTWSS